MPQPRTLEYADPLGDIAMIVSELRMRGMSAHGSVFVAYFVRFENAADADTAVEAARGDGWATALFQSASGPVLRLSRQGSAQVADLTADRDYLRGFAGAHSGRWEGLAVEDFAPDRYWERIAEQFIARSAAPVQLATRRQKSA